MKVHTYADWQARKERDAAWTRLVNEAFACVAPLAVSEEAPTEADRPKKQAESAPSGEEISQ